MNFEGSLKAWHSFGTEVLDPMFLARQKWQFIVSSLMNLMKLQLKTTEN